MEERRTGVCEHVAQGVDRFVRRLCGEMRRDGRASRRSFLIALFFQERDHCDASLRPLSHPFFLLHARPVDVPCAYTCQCCFRIAGSAQVTIMFKIAQRLLSFLDNAKKS